MGITLVLRGEDHLGNTPRQLLILEALGLPIPRYAHVALVLGMDGVPLSKRQGDLSLQELRRRGFLPGALRNHLVRLGHSCAEGWLDDKTLVSKFDVSRLGSAPAKFDIAQLRHWQTETVAHLSPDEFTEWTRQHPPDGLTK
jgi:glutamyl/glutaminyl-tRNA synthetase